MSSNYDYAYASVLSALLPTTFIAMPASTMLVVASPVDACSFPTPPHPVGGEDSTRLSSLTSGGPEDRVAAAIAQRDAWRKANGLEISPSSTGTASKACDVRKPGKPGRNLGHCNPNSSTSRFNPHEFPSLRDTRHLKQRKKKFGPPFDTDDWYFKCSVKKKEFPFEDMADEAVKIKFTPIWLWWQSHRQSSSDGELEGRAAFQLNRGRYYGTSRWFRPPPKVRIVPGILGPPPSMVTRVKHPEGGEWKVEDNLHSEYRPPDKVSPSQLDLDSYNSPNPTSRLGSRQALARFVKHLWKGATPRSFATVVRAEPAPVVKVAMQPRGGGRRGGFRQGREGF